MTTFGRKDGKDSKSDIPSIFQINSETRQLETRLLEYHYRKLQIELATSLPYSHTAYCASLEREPSGPSSPGRSPPPHSRGAGQTSKSGRCHHRLATGWFSTLMRTRPQSSRRRADRGSGSPFDDVVACYHQEVDLRGCCCCCC